MSGLRIHHPELFSCTLLIPLLPNPKTATKRARAKDIHIHLDSKGDSIVSEGVWNQLIEAKQSGLSPHSFVILDEIHDPPTLVMSQNKAGEQERTYRQTPNGIYDSDDVRAIVQSFAPKGVKARITSKFRRK